MPVERDEKHGSLLRRQTNTDGDAAAQMWRQAMADYAQLDVEAGAEWVELGPSPLEAGPEIISPGENLDPAIYTTKVSGMVTDIVIDPSGTTDQVIYISTSGGGVWKTTNGGTDWQLKTAGVPSLSMGSVAIDPGNPSIVYAGTGPIFGSRSLRYYRRVGLYKSIDAGETWWIADGGFFATVLHDAGINRIVLPGPGVLLVATDYGLFRSVDGGMNFGNNAPQFNNGLPLKLGNPKPEDPPQRISDLHLDTTDSNRVYAAVSGTGIFRSTDKGLTFPDNVFTGSETPPKPYRDVVFGQSASPDNQTFFASVQIGATPAPDDRYIGMFRSVDGGKTWAGVPGAANANQADVVYGPSQSRYDMLTVVDPRNPKRVYLGLQSLWLSRDGGRSFQRCDSWMPALPEFLFGAGGSRLPSLHAFPVHVDYHALVFSPPSHWAADDPPRDAILNARIAEYQAIVNDPATSPRDRKVYEPLLAALSDKRTTLFVGNDGGIYKNLTPDVELKDWQNLNDNGIGTILCAGMDIIRGKTRPSASTYAGFQDNGTAILQAGAPNDGSAFSKSWMEVVGGDGSQLAVDPSNSNTIFAFIGANLNRSTDAGGTWSNRTLSTDKSGITWSEHALAIERTGTDPAKRRAWVSTGPRLYRSDDGADSFELVKTFDKNIISIGTQPQESTTPQPASVWVGLQQGELHFSANAGANWDKGSFEPQTGGTGDVECIAIDPANPARVVAVLSGYSMISSVFRTRHVFMTTDSGKSWADIGGNDTTGPIGNVPDMPVNWAVITATGIVIATASGVLVSRDNGASWKVLGTGFPVVDTLTLAYDASVAPPVLRAATWGRGCWELLTFQGPRIAVEANAAFGWVPVGGQGKTTVTIFNTGDAALVCSLNTGSLPGSMRFDAALPPSISIPAGKTQVLTLLFEPVAAGDVSGSFAITNNDATPARQTWTVPVSGSAVAAATPRLGVRPRSFYFGAGFTGGGRIINTSILNAGASPATLTQFKFNDGDSGFGDPVGPAPGAIPFAGKLDYKVQFKPTPAFSVLFSTPQFRGNYQVTGNDPRSPMLVEATGTRIGGAYPLLEILLGLTGIGLIVVGIQAIRKLT